MSACSGFIVKTAGPILMIFFLQFFLNTCMLRKTEGVYLSLSACLCGMCVCVNMLRKTEGVYLSLSACLCGMCVCDRVYVCPGFIA